MQRRRARLTCLGPRVPVLDTRRVKPPPKRRDDVYGAPEYRAWRAAVIARAGGRCQDPMCKTPERRGMRLFADHIVELRDGGDLLGEGLARCGSCHTRKTNEARAARLAQ